MSNLDNESKSDIPKNDFFEGKTFLGISPFITILLSYITSWVGGLIVLLCEKENKAVRKCAAQALVMGVILVVIPILFGILPLPRVLERTISSILNIGWTVGTILCIVKAKQGEHFKLPIIDDIADKVMEITTGKNTTENK